jgi:4-diphosphocytidyl-2-C-methyl-D-erythritol kinase
MTTHPPAKINLSLTITGKRDDGFHELETLVLPLPGLTDQLNFEKSDRYSLHCATAGVPTNESNLVSRAVRLFEKETGITCPYRVTLEKRIPHGAGLGGGSADAAHALLALNKLTGANLAIETLADWSAQIGSDLPLFLYQSPCLCRGRGEIIEPLDLSWNRPILLFKPSFGIPTPWAYSRWKDSKEIRGVSYSQQRVDDITLVNDLERPVFEKHRFLAELKKFLLEQPETDAAMMSGSGSTVFAVLRNPREAEALKSHVLAKLDPTLWSHLCQF